MPQMEALRDSIFKAYPNTVAAIKVDVKGATDLHIVLGGGELFKTAADKRQQMANDVGLMAVRIFGRDSYIKTARLVITKDERNTSDEPADGIVSGINVDSLKKSIGY